MAIKLSGLVSGMDTDSMVEELVSAYSIKKQKYVNEQTKLQWTADKWSDLNTQIYNLYSKKLGNMKLTSGYVLKKATSSNTSKATVTAGTSAVNGTQSLKIKQLAKSAYLTGGKISATDGSTLSATSKLSKLGITGNTVINANGKNINIGANTTINSLISSLKDAGLSANFDATNQRFFINAKKSGAAGEFSITSESAGGVDAIKALGLFTASTSDIAAYRTSASLDKDATILSRYDASKMANMTADDVRTALDRDYADFSESLASAQNDYDTATYMKNYALMSDDDKALEKKSNQDIIDGFGSRKDLSDDEKTQLADAKANISILKNVDSSIKKAKAADAKLTEEARKEDPDAPEVTTTFDKYVENLGTSADTASEQITDLNRILDENRAMKEHADADDSDFADYVTQVNDQIDSENADLHDTITAQVTEMIDTAKSYVQAYDLVNDPDADKTSAAYTAAINLLGMNNGGTGAVKIEGQDAVIELNGAEFTSNTNTFQVNGLTINALSTTGDDPMSITTDTDNQGIYDMIKEFFTDYNSLLSTMDSSYNAASSKGYDPLTDDQKASMTDTEIEQWESKIKDSLLRNDLTLSSITNVIKTAMGASYTVNGKKYSLSSFGIKTAGYYLSEKNERSEYHIDGDPDDELTSTKSDKLLKAIASDPDTFIDFFKQLSTATYDAIDKKMSSSTLSSKYKVYNDKYMNTQITDLNKTIKTWDGKIDTMRTKWEKQFASMETSLSKLNSTQSQITSLIS